jgi:putative iron-regulated protein
LQDALAAFVADPSEATHAAAKSAWLAANEPYGQTEAYRFYGGPIDDAGGPEGLLNAWPLDEAYIDYVDGAPDAGIINNVDEYPAITKDLLVSLNEAGAEENISTGYHAIEFLLWGQDFDAAGSGQRTYTDYVVGGDVPHADRRGQYLLAAASQLVDNLATLKAAWDPAAAGNYRAGFLAGEPDVALEGVLTGLGVLAKSELAGERMFTALDNRDQEDEHSCFSDNTHRDIITNQQGIANVYTGSYTRLDGSTITGPSLADVVAAVDPELNRQMLALLAQSSEQVNAIYVPFDQAIVLPEERTKVFDAVMTLQDLGDKIAEVAGTLGLAINTALPE